MGYITKLEVGNLSYEVDKENVESINVNREHGLVEIHFKESEWDIKIISIHNVGSVLIKEEYPNINTTIGGF
jgi:hypothetical protein